LGFNNTKKKNAKRGRGNRRAKGGGHKGEKKKARFASLPVRGRPKA